MSAQHTPGPWLRYDNDLTRWVWIGDDAVQAPTEADARLIAAAPQLLEALEMAVDQMVASAKDEARRRGYEYCEERCDAIVAARAAIAAASGQA